MRKYLNKKATMDIGFQSIFNLLRPIFVVIMILSTLTVVGCFNQSKQEQLDLIKKQEFDSVINEIKSCSEQGISEQILEKCITRKNAGFRILSEDLDFVVNRPYYEKEFCGISKKHLCDKQPREFTVKVNNEIKKVSVDLVMIK